MHVPFLPLISPLSTTPVNATLLRSFLLRYADRVYPSNSIFFQKIISVVRSRLSVCAQRVWSLFRSLDHFLSRGEMIGGYHNGEGERGDPKPPNISSFLWMAWHWGGDAISFISPYRTSRVGMRDCNFNRGIEAGSPITEFDVTILI